MSEKVVMNIGVTC